MVRPTPGILPGRAVQQVDLRSRLAFHWRARDLSLKAVTGQEGTFSRSSPGGLVRGRGWLRNTDRLRAVGPHQDDLPRFHLVKNADGIYVPSLLLEGQRQNQLTRWAELDHGDWLTTSGSVTADDARAPNRALAADLVEGSGGGFPSVQQDKTVADDSEKWALSVFVKKASGVDPARLDIEFRDGTTELFYRVSFDHEDGTVTDQSTPDSIDDAQAEDWSDDFWRIWIVGSNNGTGNTTLRPRLRINDDSGDESAHYWGAQLEKAAFPSSPIPTAGSAVTRNAENLWWDFDLPPVAMTVYCRWVHLGTVVGADRLGVMSIGDAAQSTPILKLQNLNDGNLEAIHTSSGGSSVADGNSGNFTGISLLDEVESRAVLHADGHMLYGQSIEGAVEETHEDTGAAPGLDSAWSDARIWLGSRGSSKVGFAGHRELKVSRGVQDMATMRELL